MQKLTNSTTSGGKTTLVEVRSYTKMCVAQCPPEHQELPLI